MSFMCSSVIKLLFFEGYIKVIAVMLKLTWQFIDELYKRIK